MVSCCLHALLFSICRRSEADLISKKLATISVRMVGKQIGPEIEAPRKSGEKVAKKLKIGRNSNFSALLSPPYSGRDLLPDLFVFLCRAEGPKPIF